MCANTRFGRNLYKNCYFPSINKSHIYLLSGYSTWSASTPHQISSQLWDRRIDWLCFSVLYHCHHHHYHHHYNNTNDDNSSKNDTTTTTTSTTINNNDDDDDDYNHHHCFVWGRGEGGLGGGGGAIKSLSCPRLCRRCWPVTVISLKHWRLSRWWWRDKKIFVRIMDCLTPKQQR